MPELLPFKSDIYLYYKCDECGAEHQQHIRATNEIGKLLCYCGKILNLQKVKEPRIVAINNNTQEINTNKESVIPNKPLTVNKFADNNITKEDFKVVYRSLKKLGYPSSVIKDSMNKTEYTGNISQYMTDCIRNIQ